MSTRDYSDLIASLRDMARRTYVHDDLSVNDYEDAAAAIKHLQREVERLRDLLRECRLALIWSADEASDEFLARLGAAIGDDK